MKAGKRLTLRRELLSDLSSDQLLAVGGGTFGATFMCEFTGGVSCGGVCSINCGNTFTCPAEQAVEILLGALPTAVG